MANTAQQSRISHLNHGGILSFSFSHFHFDSTLPNHFFFRFHFGQSGCACMYVCVSASLLTECEYMVTLIPNNNRWAATAFWNPDTEHHHENATNLIHYFFEYMFLPGIYRNSKHMKRETHSTHKRDNVDHNVCFFVWFYFSRCCSAIKWAGNKCEK